MSGGYCGPDGHMGCLCPCAGAYHDQQSIDRQHQSDHAAIRLLASLRQTALDRQQRERDTRTRAERQDTPTRRSREPEAG